jgi:regulatory helix-turn-helix LysR family protein
MSTIGPSIIRGNTNAVFAPAKQFPGRVPISEARCRQSHRPFMEPTMRGNHFAELSALVAVAEQASFTNAAKRLGLSTATLSQTVRALETRLGVRLLNRTRRGLDPGTATGLPKRSCSTKSQPAAIAPHALYRPIKQPFERLGTSALGRGDHVGVRGAPGMALNTERSSGCASRKPEQ